MPRISPEEPDAFQLLDFNSYFMITPIGAEKCPYNEVFVDNNNEDWESSLSDSIEKSSDPTVSSNPFITDFNGDPRFN